MARLGLAVIHGMGSQNEKFAEKFEKELRDRLDPSADVAIQPLWWADVVEQRQNELYGRLEAGGDLDATGLRQFVFNSLGDAIAYQKTGAATGRDETSIYALVHALIGRKMHELAQAVGPNAPLVIAAHSLGCHMISNYIWDTDAGQNPFVVDRDSPFETFKTLTSIFTFGCNIPLFLLANNEFVPIAFPRDVPGVPPELRRWINFYDPDDVLGYPLKPLSDAYGKAVHEDRAINAGGLLSLTPLSHTGYWKDRDVLGPIAKTVNGILSSRA